MTWSNNNNDSETSAATAAHAHLQIITPTQQDHSTHVAVSKSEHQLRTIICPSCGHTVKIQDQSGVQDLPGLPAGVKFDPSDQEILQHLEAKVYCDVKKLHPLIDEFIPTIEGQNGICYTHPEKLPGVSKEGQIRHFFHRPSKAYTTGTRKRRKVQTEDEEGGETRWHKTGKTRAVSAPGNLIKGYKKILVLYTNYGRQRKPEKTNWVMHQYHLGHNEEEKDGELVLSKVFYQTQPRQCASKPPLINTNNNNNSPSPFQLVKNHTAHFVDYYNNSAAAAAAALVSNYRDTPTSLIPNLVVHGDGSSSFIHLPSPPSKPKSDI